MPRSTESSSEARRWRRSGADGRSPSHARMPRRYAAASPKARLSQGASKASSPLRRGMLSGGGRGAQRATPIMWSRVTSLGRAHPRSCPSTSSGGSGKDHVADLRARVPDAHLDVVGHASCRTRRARPAARAPFASGRRSSCTSVGESEHRPRVARAQRADDDVVDVGECSPARRGARPRRRRNPSSPTALVPSASSRAR